MKMKVLNAIRPQTQSIKPGLIRVEASKDARPHTRFPAARLRSFRGAGEEGNAILEMAFALPILVMMVFGLFYFGIYIAYYQALTQAVGAAGQYLSHDRGYAANPCLIAVQQMQAASPMNLLSNNLSVQVLYNGASLGTNSCSGTASSNLGTTGGGTVQVIGTYNTNCPIPTVTTNRIFCSPLVAQVTEYVY